MSTLALPPATQDRPRRVLNTGAFLAGLANVMVVGGLFAAYIQVRHVSAEWPPLKIDNYLGGTLVVTVLLSAITAEWFAWGVRTGNRRQTLVGGSMTLGFGLAFGNLVWYALAQANFGPGTSAYGTLFFAILLVSAVIAATGFAFVLVALVRFAGNQVTTSDTDGARAAAIYWHFVVLSWLLAALAVYVFQHK